MAEKIQRFNSTVYYNPIDDIRFEHNSGERVTIEGETYTIQELFARHLNQHDPNVALKQIFEDTEDFDMPDLSKIKQMDMFDQRELYAEIELRASEARKNLEKLQREKERQVIDDANERSVETQGEPPTPPNPEARVSGAPVVLDNTGAK